MRLNIRARLLSLAAMTFVISMLVPSTPLPSGAGNGFLGKAVNLTFGVEAAGDQPNNDSEVVCQLRPGASAVVVAARYAMTIKRSMQGNTYVFTLPRTLPMQLALSRLRTDPDVRSAEPNYAVGIPEVSQRSVAFVDGSSSSTNYYFQDALGQIRARDAWPIADGSGITVAVIDTGIDATHPVFTHITRGYDWVGNDPNPSEVSGGPAYGHGTMVAGIIVAVAPGATIMPLRVFRPDGTGDAADVADAIVYATDHGADIINMSFGLSEISAAIQRSILYAWIRGVALIGSAGNANSSLVQFPANDLAHVVSVAAVNGQDNKADFSNYGNYVDVCAPGTNIHSAYPGGQFAVGGGTSHATAFVSGEMALVLSEGGGWARSAIENSAVNIDALNPGYRNQLGKGRIDALAAVSQRR